MPYVIFRVAIDTPLDSFFDYRFILNSEDKVLPQIGQLVLVPFGKRKVIGMIIAILKETDVPEEKLKDVIAIRQEVQPVSSEWLDLCHFAAGYYQRPLGEVVLPCLPKKIREEKTVTLSRVLKAIEKKETKVVQKEEVVIEKPELNSNQQKAVSQIIEKEGFSPILLHGVTGSGKTEVYLRACETILARHSQATVMILVPEINLTPQLENNIRTRFPEYEVAVLHSQLSESERLRNWLMAHTGHTRILLGTRMTILASVPRLDLIIVDEEHDPSYKQQESLRYSARDLAVWRAQQLKIPVVLGSATPSLETWYNVQLGRYHKLHLPNRATDTDLPQIKLIDTSKEKLQEGISSVLLEAIQMRLDRKEQSLLFLNRRGYAHVLACDACGWLSACKQCSAYMVLHKSQYRLRCHHCSMELYIPKACPSCGYVDLKPIGRGTERVEETIQQYFPRARILRIDADSTRKKGSMQKALMQVHQGETDILVGTQMIAKGHDFQNLTLVGVINADMALFSHDYRASERLFAQLMQVGGRAGRHTMQEEKKSEVIIQTRYPSHPLYQALLKHDYDGFASNLLEERQEAKLPPFIYQVLLCAEAKQKEIAMDFLEKAAKVASYPEVIVNDPVPMAMPKVGNIERVQLLVEANSRAHMQRFLKQWISDLYAVKTKAKWYIEVDPASI